jgi:HPt (histidine-containing phosphotransfer) domain-containing protein
MPIDRNAGLIPPFSGQADDAVDVAVFDETHFNNLQKLIPPGTFIDLVEEFLRETGLQARRIEQFAAADDLAGLQREAHDLVANAGNFGARRLEHLARGLEAASAAGNRDAAATLVAEIIAQAGVALAAIGARMEAPPASTDGAAET